VQFSEESGSEIEGGSEGAGKDGGTYGGNSYI